MQEDFPAVSWQDFQFTSTQTDLVEWIFELSSVRHNFIINNHKLNKHKDFVNSIIGKGEGENLTY